MRVYTPLLLLLSLFFYAEVQAQTNIVQKELSDTEKEVFKERALQKVNELEGYIITITDKTIADKSIKDKAISTAVSLFLDEERTVEVSSVKSNSVRSYDIKKYLFRINAIPYTQVKIDWYDIAYIRDLRAGPDNTYYGTITVFQKFQGFVDGKLVYEDETQKNIDVIIKTVEKVMANRTVETREVLLGDIKVVETR